MNNIIIIIIIIISINIVINIIIISSVCYPHQELGTGPYWGRSGRPWDGLTPDEVTLNPIIVFQAVMESVCFSGILWALLSPTVRWDHAAWDIMSSQLMTWGEWLIIIFNLKEMFVLELCVPMA